MNATTTMYRLLSYGRNQIEPVEVTKVTPHFVFYIDVSWDKKSNRVRRANRIGHFFDTWEEARAYWADSIRKDIERYKYSENNANSRLGEVLKMVQP